MERKISDKELLRYLIYWVEGVCGQFLFFFTLISVTVWKGSTQALAGTGRLRH